MRFKYLNVLKEVRQWELHLSEAQLERFAKMITYTMNYSDRFDSADWEVELDKDPGYHNWLDELDRESADQREQQQQGEYDNEQ